MSKKVINLETLEIYNSQKEAAIKLGTHPTNIWRAILMGHKAKGNRIEDFEMFTYMTNKEKEKYTRKNNIYFI